MKELIKEFKHIARDTTIYLLPGLFLFGYCLFLYTLNNHGFDWRISLELKMMIIILFISYILGHLIMGLMEFLFVLIPVEKQIKKMKIFRERSKQLIILEEDYQEGQLETMAFADKDKYEFFVERHTLLSLFRWNLSGVFLIISIISFIVIFIIDFPWYVSLIEFFVFFYLLLFSIQTDLDGKFRRFYLAKKQIV